MHCLNCIRCMQIRRLKRALLASKPSITPKNRKSTERHQIAHVFKSIYKALTVLPYIHKQDIRTSTEASFHDLYIYKFPTKLPFNSQIHSLF